MKPMKKTGIFIIILILLAGAGGWYWWESRPSGPALLYGNVDIRTVNLGFRVGGKLQSLNADEGAVVQPGELLGMLDDTPYRHALLKAEGVRDSAQAALLLMETGYRPEEIAQAKADVARNTAAAEFARQFYQRQAGLMKSRAISANDLENARNQRNQADAALKASQDKLNQLENGYRKEEIAEARGQLKQAEAAVEQAQLDLADTRLTAPAEGTILTRAIEPGTILPAGSTVFTLTLTNPVWVRAYVSESELGQAQPGRKVLLETDSRPGKPYHGHVGFVSPTAEFTPKSVETPALRTDLVYRLRIVVTDADPLLRQGMPVTIRFDNEEPQP
ncbi:TPA: secretion protein HlyD [Morganella morganii]|uniref:secretion protein HlyD n=1 Tax=Morganella morganii TaxID=582 RepID=UPI001BD20D2C|nr:secretion protein HlyD [Morganella morganii]HBL6964002.1 secretion protein HlyD [Morganella morganii]